MNKVIIKQSVQTFLQAIEPSKLNDDIVFNTPERVAKSWLEMLGGYEIDDKTLYKTFPADNNNLVVVKNIEFTSICEHHLLPFSGVISMGYIPNGKVLGLSKFARIVNCFARRLQLQEKLVNDIAKSIQTNLEVKDLFIVAEAKHSCMACRGVNQRASSTLTFFASGKFRDYRENEIMGIMGN